MLAPGSGAMTAPSWPETGLIYTPGRHRQLARIWLKHAGEPGYPTVARAKQMAINHDQAARLITVRLAKAGITTPLVLAAPSIAAELPGQPKPRDWREPVQLRFPGF